MHHLILTGGELVHGLPQRGETYHYLMLLRVDGGSARRFRDDHRGHGLRNRCPLRLFGLWRPTKFRSVCRDYLLGYLAVRLPSQSGYNTETNRDQIAAKPPREPRLFISFSIARR